MTLHNSINRARYALYTGAAALLVPALSMAQESSGTTIGPVTQGGQDWSATYQVGTLTAVDNVAGGLREMFGKVLGSLVPVLGAVILAGVAVWALPKIVGIIKSAFQTSKGR